MLRKGKPVLGVAWAVQTFELLVGLVLFGFLLFCLVARGSSEERASKEGFGVLANGKALGREQ